MWKKITKEIYSKNSYEINLRISLLNFNFAMIYVIHKILPLIKNRLDGLKDIISNVF